MRLNTPSFAAGTLLSLTVATITAAQAPERSAPPDRLNLDAAVAQNLSPGAADFDVITVGQAIAEATDKNLDLIAQRLNIPIAQARILTARLRPNPIFSLEASHLNYPITPDFNNSHAGGPNEFAIRSDFLWERGDKRERRIAVAEASHSVAEFEVLNAIRTLALSVETAFVDILEAKANLDLARDSLSTFEDLLKVNAIRVRNGDLAEVELLRTEVAEVQFENSVRQAELQTRTARAKLQLLLGRSSTDRQVDASGDMRRDEVHLPIDALIERAIASRPDVRAERQDQIRSQAELRLQLAQGIVDYTIGSEYRRQQGASSFGNLMGFFFSTNLPVFNRNQGEIARATQEQSQVQSRLRSLEASVQNEVQIAYLQYANAQAILGRLESTLLDRAKDVRQITEYSYRRGEASFLEFLDAQRAYNETMQTYNQARGEFARSRYGIDAAIGEGTIP